LNTKFLYGKALEYFEHAPTMQQVQALQMLVEFVLNPEAQVFVLKGSAGTGKTTLTTALANALKPYMAVHLMAPTGRAAKVMGQYSGLKAETIHRHIYVARGSVGSMSFQLKHNKETEAIYLVDEASMIPATPENSLGRKSSLLEDLIEYVFSGHHCKIIFIGDSAQLPPIGAADSPALNPHFLHSQFYLDLTQVELTEVVRQAKSSQILSNATLLRDLLQQEIPRKPVFTSAREFRSMNDMSEIQDVFGDCFDSRNSDDSVVLVRSNKRANMYNNEIRSRILFKDNEIDSGDKLMIVKNNYHWLEAKSPAGFLANGDFLEIIRIRGTEEKFGFRFLEASLQLPDFPEQPPFEGLLLLDTLTTESPSLSAQQQNQLYTSVWESYNHIPFKGKRMEALKNDRYFNAIQIKFAYAVTVHKAQGGQWKNVFVEKPYLPEDQMSVEYLRWLYTAITRSKNQVFMLGFEREYFVGEW